MGLKIVVIGGASSYSPELFADVTDGSTRLDIEQITLMDLNTEKLAFVGGVCQRLLDAAGSQIRLVTTPHLEEAVAGADFILLQVRIGGLAARVWDEKLPVEFNMVGNETTGAGGFVCALRTVPVVLEIARAVERLAPQAWLLNMSNPAGIVTEALLKHSQVRTIGFCNIPINTTYALADVLHVLPSQIQLDSFGLNHLSWVRRVYVEGEDRLQPLIAATHSHDSALYQRGLVDRLMDLDFLQILRLIPSWYVRYFYFTEQVLEEERHSRESKGQRDMLAEEQLRQIYSSVGYDEQARRILAAKGGAQYYLPVLQVMDAIVNDSGDIVVVDVRNGQALPDLPPEVYVEVPARIYREGVEPLPIGPMPLSVRGLVQAVKAYEELTIEAALNGDRGLAIEALMANPLVGSYSRAKPFFDRVLENERPYLPAFFA